MRKAMKQYVIWYLVAAMVVIGMTPKAHAGFSPSETIGLTPADYTMTAVGVPVFYSDVTTAIGFAALATGAIVPVRIFGLAVGFGTLVILLLSYTLVPAVLMLMPEKGLVRMALRGTSQTGASGKLLRLGDFCVRQAKLIALAGGLLLAWPDPCSRRCWPRRSGRPR